MLDLGYVYKMRSGYLYVVNVKCDPFRHGKCFSFVSCDILLPPVWIVGATGGNSGKCGFVCVALVAG